jgi:glycosyltransferase involved in cell wall biosynthesis
MKVLLTLTSSSSVRGGVEIFSSHLKKAVPGLEIVDYDSIRPQFREPFPLLKNPVYAKRLDEWFMKNSNAYRPEIVFTNGMDGWNLKASLGCPVINIQHGTFAAFAEKAMKKTSPNYWRIRHIYARYERLSAAKATRIIANSPFTRENLKKYYRLESGVINNAVDTETIRPVKNARKILGLPEDKDIGIFVGRPDYTKGFDIVEAVAEKFPDMIFLCITPFPFRPRPRNMLAFSGLPHKKLCVYYSAADICINPSRFEGFGYVPLESLACNTPVIGNPTGVFASFKVTGFSPVERNVPEFYFKKLTDVLSSPEKSRHEIKKLFSFRQFSKAYRKIADAALA